MTRRVRWGLVVVGLCAFALFVWPTRYDRYTYEGMTVLRDRLRGCEKILTPAGPRSVGGDARCFLPGEEKSASVILVMPDREVTEPDEASEVGDVASQELGLLNFTAAGQLRVMEGLEVTVTLTRPRPVLRVVNRSACTVEAVTLRIRRFGRRQVERKVDTGVLTPGQEVQTPVSLGTFPMDPQITLPNVMFHDNGDVSSSACASAQGSEGSTL